MTRRASTAALLAIAASVASLVLAAGAQAIIVHLRGGQTISVQPLRRPLGPAPLTKALAKPLARPLASKKPLIDHGGPVMTSNTNYAFYWDPAGAPAYPAGYVAGVDKWFEDLAHDSGGLQNTDSVLIQYGASYESHFGGALNDTDPYPHNGCEEASICLTDAQIQTELRKYIEANGLPQDLSHTYFVLTPPGVESCSKPGECSPNVENQESAEYCAYHSVVKNGSKRIVYADNPYVDGTTCEDGQQPNGSSDGAISGGLAHEHSESVTDPELNAWFDAKGEEVADKCNAESEAFEYGPPLGKAPDGSNYNQVINSSLYWYQQEWSNEAVGCQQRAAAPPTIKKIAPKAGGKSGGTRVTITGTGFNGTVNVYFGENAGTGVEVTGPTQVSVTTPAAAAPGKVNVTVRTASGTSEVTKKTVFKYKPKG
jgi:hypothetical protein